MDLINGEIFLVNKPYKWTSFDVIKSLRNTLRDKTGNKKIKIGHAGTLDPLATGLLIICTGKNTKKIESYQNLEKEYTGIIIVGAKTESGDLEKEVVKTADITNLKEERIIETVKQFTGEIQQKAPTFSAKKINGIRAYEYARKGEEVEIKANTVNIKSFEITKIDLPEVHFRIVCGKGTYIRSIAIDLGEALETGAYLSALCRTRIGEFRLDDAKEIEKLKKEIESTEIDMIN